jgi:HAD superfamily hydrolase (TIGR01509 family)
MLKAILWDVDGTLAETERDGHLVAFNRAFEALALPWRWSQERYGELLAVAGGRERLLHDMQTQPQAPALPAERAELVERIHVLKNQLYAAIIAAGALPLRAGVSELFEDCAAAGVRMAIVTTTSEANVAALLAARLGPGWRSRFAAVMCAEQAPQKKPDPQVYLRALQALKLAPEQALAIEDAPAGVGAVTISLRSRCLAHSRWVHRSAVPTAGGRRQSRLPTDVFISANSRSGIRRRSAAADSSGLYCAHRKNSRPVRARGRAAERP